MDRLLHGLITNRTNGSLQSCLQDILLLSERLRPECFSLPGKNSIELQALERQVCTHLSFGSQILPTSGMTQQYHTPLVDHDIKSGQT